MELLSIILLIIGITVVRLKKRISFIEKHRSIYYISIVFVVFGAVIAAYYLWAGIKEGYSAGKPIF